jgi:dienelactone hydrolase
MHVKPSLRLLSFLPYLLLLLLIPAASYADESANAPTASMNEEILRIPLYSDPGISLEVTVLKPDGPGPFPLIIMNHGASGKPSDEPRYHNTMAAYYFLSRGYAVVLPMMQGFAGSDGKQIMNGCNQEEMGLANAQDIQTVATYMLERPYIDHSSFIVAGQSFGGWNTLAFGTLPQPKLRGLINFSGGVIISNCMYTPPALIAAARHFGAKTKVPSLWFYGDNDSKWSISTWRSMYERYTGAGGKAELVPIGKFMNDSHNMLGFPESMRIWVPKVDAFLAQVGMPNQIVHPEYLPADFPPPSQFATIDDVDAVPYLDEQGRDTYRKFLTLHMPRVFVVSPGGLAATFNGGYDPLGRAMTACRERNLKCQVYAADDYVTWNRPTPAPTPTAFATVDDVAAVPFINDYGRKGYKKFLALRNPKAFVIASDGAWSAASEGDDPLKAALESCGKAHRDCRFYAVDGHVVWPPH